MNQKRMTPSAYALLGLLDHAPAAGYELGSIAMRTIAHFWPLTRTHIYSELARLETLGYVAATDVVQQSRPDKRVFTLTPAGAEALDEWLNDAEAPPERNRVPVLLKLFFGRRMRPDRLAALLAGYRERAQAERDVFASIVDDLAAHHPDEIYPRITALYGMRQLDAMLSWLHETEALLNPPRPGRRQ